jgi:hypothetical protein
VKEYNIDCDFNACGNQFTMLQTATQFGICCKGSAISIFTSNETYSFSNDFNRCFTWLLNATVWWGNCSSISNFLFPGKKMSRDIILQRL